MLLPWFTKPLKSAQFLWFTAKPVRLSFENQTYLLEQKRFSIGFTGLPTGFWRF
jgi:hypothetical protein